MSYRTNQCPGYIKDGQPVPCVGNGEKNIEAIRCFPCCTLQRRKRPLPADRPTAEVVQEDRARRRAQDELAAVKRNYAEALKTIERLETSIEAIEHLDKGVQTFDIKPKTGSGTSEATAVMVASDWHIEEEVAGEVGDLNSYNLDIATERATRFFQSGLRLLRLLQQDVKIPTVVLALLGDFITGNIHGEENAEKNLLLPMDAIVFVQNLLISGIEFWLRNTECEFVLPCHNGNHARTTQKTRFATENGHSLEHLLYQHLVAYFRNEPRVRFIVSGGMHSYLHLYPGAPGSTVIRFHHGHAIKYGGGVGGIFIPAYKAIAQWNKGKQADLDVFGHFHQSKDGGNFLCNGSLIGYNAFALSIKADYEPPKQTLFLIDRKRGRTCTWPILVGQKPDPLKVK